MKSFYLDEDEKSFFTQWYTNAKDVIVCEHENPMQITMITALFASENIATMEMRSGPSVLSYASSDLMKK